MEYKFNQPYEFENKTYTDIQIREDLTAADYEAAERDFRADNPTLTGSVELESGWIKILTARAANLPVEFFDRLPITEWIRLRRRVEGFLAQLLHVS